MRATKAYIASLGTTGVLLGASLFLLAVVSAVVAFDRWPNGNVSTRVQTLVLSEKPAPIRVSSRATGPSAITASRVAAAIRGAAPRGGVRTPAVLGDGIPGGRNTSPATPANPGGPVPPAIPKVPAAVPDPTPIIDRIANPNTATSEVADGAQSVTDSAGVSVGRVSPQLGDAVAGAGQTAAQTVREVPLPDHVLPGH